MKYKLTLSENHYDEGYYKPHLGIFDSKELAEKEIKKFKLIAATYEELEHGSGADHFEKHFTENYKIESLENSIQKSSKRNSEILELFGNVSENQTLNLVDEYNINKNKLTKYYEILSDLELKRQDFAKQQIKIFYEQTPKHYLEIVDNLHGSNFKFYITTAYDTKILDEWDSGDIADYVKENIEYTIYDNMLKIYYKGNLIKESNLNV